MNQPREDDHPQTPGYPEPEPQPRKGGEPDEGTPHEHQNVPEKKPQETR